MNYDLKLFRTSDSAVEKKSEGIGEGCLSKVVLRAGWRVVPSVRTKWIWSRLVGFGSVLTRGGNDTRFTVRIAIELGG